MEKTYYDLPTFKALCEKEAERFVDPKYCSPSWAKNIRGEYVDMIFGSCKGNLNEAEGIFNADGVDMDLASSIGAFFQKHPHIDYVCPASWRGTVLNKLKANFTECATAKRSDMAILGEDDATATPVDSSVNPNQPLVQSLHDVSNRVWSAWRVMTDLVSTRIVAKKNAGEVEDKDFTNAVKVRDALRKMAADIDDLGIAFQIVKKDEEESKD